MKIEQLKMLKVVAEQGTLKAASEHLHKTQAAVSKGIKQLESSLDLQLFNRDGYRMTLTTEGEQIFQLALTLLNKASEIENLSYHLKSGNEASVTLAFDSAFDISVVLPVLERVQKDFPDTQIIIRQEQISGAIEALDLGHAEIAISIMVSELSSKNTYEMEHLYQGEIINVASPTLLARHPNLKYQRELEKEYQIILQDTGNQTRGVTYGVQDSQRCWYVNDLTTKKILTLSGMGWGMLPHHLVADELATGKLQKIQLVDYKKISTFNYFVLKQKNQALGPVASLLWEGIKRLNIGNTDNNIGYKEA